MSGSHECSEHSQHQELLQKLDRQAAAMERLADLLPQLVAANMALVQALAGDDDEDDGQPKYLDGS